SAIRLDLAPPALRRGMSRGSSNRGQPGRAGRSGGIMRSPTGSVPDRQAAATEWLSAIFPAGSGQRRMPAAPSIRLAGAMTPPSRDSSRGTPHAFSQIAIGELRRIGGDEAGCRDDQHGFRDVLEIGAEMHRALEGEDLLRGRLEAEMPEDRLACRLLAPAADNHADAVLLEQGHGAERHLAAAIHRAAAGKAPVAERAHRE